MADRFPPHWEELPDFGLYMDQVISLAADYLSKGGQTAEPLSPSMVNNYVKMGLLPRPEGKKYTRTHLAQLLMIARLKSVLSMEEIGHLFRVTGQDITDVYASFCRAAESVREIPDEDPMRCAVSAAARRSDAVNAIERLWLARPAEGPPQKPKKKKEKTDAG